jgi:mannitol-1-/sugar-/sorbitol-6-/2-deoxyglucose-6-phosphatase
MLYYPDCIGNKTGGGVSSLVYVFPAVHPLTPQVINLPLRAMIRGVIFDMDGLLVDSEPWWREAETNVFGALSKAPAASDFEEMMGNRIEDVIARWRIKHPWQGMSDDAVKVAIVDEVQRLVTSNAQLLPGVVTLLELLHEKKIPVALASSSPLRLIRGLMQHYGIYNFFQVVCSAEAEVFGKPHPAVFLTAARHLGIEPAELLVFEDSFNGVIAAKAARMKCVAVPAPEHASQPRFAAADLVLTSLTMFDEDVWEMLSR